MIARKNVWISRAQIQVINDTGKRLVDDLIILEPNDKSEGFDHLIGEIVILFDRYCPDPYFREDNEFSQEEFQKWLSLKL